jgi:nitrate/nitrite-specific signal transduction histidine kinase
MAIDEEKGVSGRAEEFLQLFKKGAEFTQELLKENELLRYRLVQLEQRLRAQGGSGGHSDHASKLSVRIAELESEKQHLLERMVSVERENQDFATRYVEIETENNNLANLYIASFQLHSTLDFREVLQIIIEIIINLIGAEEFAILLLDEKTQDLNAVATEGIAREDIPPIKLGGSVVGKVAETGESHFAADVAAYQRDIMDPMACIPLKIKEHVIGVIVIYKLLIQKKEFAPVDFELFTLLAGHAATAIFSSRLYSESERKLSTIQGFLELLTK